MRPLVFHSLPVALLVAVVALGGGLIESRARARFGPRRHRGAREWGFIAAMMTKFACDALAVVIALRHVAPLPGGVWWPTIVGILIVALGFSLRTWAVVALGRFFQLTVVIQDEHRVIDSGPYRFVRHPAYLGLIVTSVGFGLIASDWLALAIMVVAMTLALAVRIKGEERELLQALGERYAAYMRNTASLLPGLY